MSKELTDFEIQRAQDAASIRNWEQTQSESRTPVLQRQVRAVLEAAADNPLAMTIFARTVIRGESYAQAVDFVARRVTNRTISNGAARVAVHRIRSVIEGR